MLKVVGIFPVILVTEDEPRYFYTCDECGKPMKKPYLLMKFDEDAETECHLCCECAQSVLDFIMHNVVNHRKNCMTNNGKEEYKPSGGIS